MKPFSPLRHTKKWGYQLTGLCLVSLGMIGIILPVMPSTIFFILALACFSRSSPRLQRWLLSHPRFGAGLSLWQQHKVIPPVAKKYAVIGICIGFIALLLTAAPLWVKALVAIIDVAVITYIVTRPSRLTSRCDNPPIYQLTTSTHTHFPYLEDAHHTRRINHISMSTTATPVNKVNEQ